MYKIEIGQIKRKRLVWDDAEFYGADEWVEFDNATEYSEEIRRLKKLGYKVYYQDDFETLFI